MLPLIDLYAVIYLAEVDGFILPHSSIGNRSVPINYESAKLFHKVLSDYLSLGEKVIDDMASKALDDLSDPERRSVRSNKVARKDNPGFVYLLKSDSGFYKIGLTAHPEKRLKHFTVKLPYRVAYECLIPTEHMRNLEAELHERFAEKRIDGEWFDLSPADVEYIKGLAK